MKKFLFFLLCLSVPCLAQQPATLAPDSPFQAKVQWVSDGDTVALRLDSGRRLVVRLRGVDAPEVAHSATKERPAIPGQAHGAEAKAELIELAINQRVTVTHSHEYSWGRLVATLTREDGKDLASELVERGAAHYVPRYGARLTGEQRAKYQAAHDAAKNNQIGLWAAPIVETPAAFRGRTLPRP